MKNGEPQKYSWGTQEKVNNSDPQRYSLGTQKKRIMVTPRDVAGERRRR